MELEAKFGELPLTPTSATGGGGLHFFFKHPGGIIKNSASKIGPGLDLRGTGGYVVAPPSVHINGHRYAWVAGRGPADVPLALPPTWLTQHARVDQDLAHVAIARARARRLVKGGAGEGERNNAVTQITGHLLRHRVDPEVALDLVLAWNALRNTPPLRDAEVRAAVDSIAGRELLRRGGRHG
jgi:Bifunctional DNA primase/polymerase, N-terminal/Primase C terminal 1 (PriCT-1)